MRQRSRRILPAVLVATISGTAVLAQPGNQIANGQFDTLDGTAGWTAHSGGYSTVDVGTFDADGCTGQGLGSGSAKGTNTANSDFAGASFYWTCIEGPPVGEPFALATAFYFDNHTVPGNASTVINFYDTAGCSGTDVGGGLNSGGIVSTAIGWQRVRNNTGVVPVGAASARVWVLLIKTLGADSSLTVYFDDVQLLNPSWIYAEDFEIADTCRWSVALP